MIYNYENDIIEYAINKKVSKVHKSELVKCILDNNDKYVQILGYEIKLDEWLKIDGCLFMNAVDWNEYTGTKIMDVINLYNFIL